LSLGKSVVLERMKLSKVVTVVDSHTAGMPTRVITGGIPNIPGRTMAEKRDYFTQNMDHLRTMLLFEPRGHQGMFGAVLTSPCRDEADVGVFYLDSKGTEDMCGHGTIGVTTTLIELGMIPAKEPVTKVTLDTPAGLIQAEAKSSNGMVENVTLRNVPSFLYQGDKVIKVPNIGNVKVDIGYGGNWFAFVSAEEIGVKVRIEAIEDLINKGVAIRDAVQRQVKTSHPDPHIDPEIKDVMICDASTNPRAHAKNVVIFPKRGFDRSPCGTGTSARMAALYAKGKLGLNEEFVHESVIGSLFRGRLVKETKVGDIAAVVPEITGSAYLTGIHQFVIDPRDPYKYGFHF